MRQPRQHRRQPLAGGQAIADEAAFRARLRAWLRAEEQWHASAPIAFEEMPLRWERAFGGSAAIRIDEASTMPLSEPMIPLGRGFDFSEIAASLGRALACPPGYPILPGPVMLPGLAFAMPAVQR